MALRELGMGLVKGLTPIVQERAQERLENKQTERELKRLEQLASLELQKKRLMEDYQVERIFKGLRGAGIDEPLARIASLGMRPSDVGFIRPLEFQEHEMKMKQLEQAIEAEKGRKAYWNRPQAGAAQTDRTKQEERLRLQAALNNVEQSLNRIGKYHKRGVPSRDEKGNIARDPMTNEVLYEEIWDTPERSTPEIKELVEIRNRLMKALVGEQFVPETIIPEDINEPVRDNTGQLQELLQLRGYGGNYRTDDPFGIMPILMPNE